MLRFISRFPASVALLLVAFGSGQASQAAVVLDRLEASVNANLILLSDIGNFRHTQKLRVQLDPLFNGTAVAAAGPKASVGDVVNFLIDEKMIAQQFPVTDAEVEQEINSIQSNNHIDRGGLKNALSEQGFSFEDYFELIRTSISKRNLIDRDIRTKVSISDDDVKNYFYNHAAKSSTAPVAYHLQIIAVSIKNYKNVQGAKETALKAAKEIKEGDAFEEVAKRLSDDTSASSGGDLGTLSDDQISPLIREQAKKLKIGAVSEIFGGPQVKRFYLLKLVDLKSNEDDRLQKMKDEIRGQLSSAEYQHQISLWLERQRQTTFIHRAGEAATAGLPTVQ